MKMYKRSLFAMSHQNKPPSPPASTVALRLLTAIFGLVGINDVNVIVFRGGACEIKNYMELHVSYVHLALSSILQYLHQTELI